MSMRVRRLTTNVSGHWRSFSSTTVRVRQPRHELLSKIYKPFSKLQEGSDEYTELAKSGKVWEDYHHPGDSHRMGYIALQQENKKLLAQIDRFKKFMELRIPKLAETLVAEYAHQSVLIEDNPLSLGDTMIIFDELNNDLFKNIDIGSMPAKELTMLPRSETQARRDSSPVIELKNHIIASQWIAENAATQLGTAGLTEDETRDLAAMAIKGTESEAVYTMGWGGRVPLGGYRRSPISVRSNPLRVFPYPPEVPACIQRFFEWRDLQHREKELHPLILACQMTAYYVHIHPFPDGNGRVSRMIMHDYLVRQGYLPVVMQNLERKDYLRMISNACDGEPREFVDSVLTTQLDELITFYGHVMRW